MREDQKGVEWPRLGMSLEETAEALRVNILTVGRLVRSGELPARKCGMSWRISPRAVEAWLCHELPEKEKKTPKKTAEKPAEAD